MRAVSMALIVYTLGCVVNAPAGRARTETVVHSFCFRSGCTDGISPLAGLINVKGVLYGTTYLGGAGITQCSYESTFHVACGTVFSFDPQTGAEAVVYSLCSRKRHPGNICTDGKLPQSGVIAVKGTLYGTTEWGGKYGYGTVFSLDPTTDTETVLYSFSDKRRDYEYGAFPDADVIDVKGTLYGTTPVGGRRGGAGTAFSLDPATGAETVLHMFSAKQKDGRDPEAGLINVSGTLYGTTEYGGRHNAGAVFALDPTTGAEAVLYSFKGYPSDGDGPVAAVLDVNGMLYGTTLGGGAYDNGTVFSIDPTTRAETVLYSFRGYPSDGVEPVAGLISVNGILYGTTEEGGDGDCENDQGEYVGCGTAFSLDPTTGGETVVYSFCSQKFCTDGEYPAAALINVNGTLYGTTEYGGAYGAGTVFSIVP